MEVSDHRGVHLRLKVWMLRAEVIETLFYGRVAWSPRKLITAGYGRSTTRCSSDALAGENESAKATFHHMLARFSGQNLRALRQQYGDIGYCLRAL